MTRSPKSASAMTSATSSSAVVAIKTTDLRVPKPMAIPDIHSKLRHFSSRTLTGRSFKILNVCIVLKNHKPVYVKHENAFYPEASNRACALKHRFDNAERKSGCSYNNWTQEVSDYLQI